MRTRGTWLLVCLMLAVMVGCVERNQSNSAGDLGDSPPQPQIIVDGKTISVYQSSYCWTTACVDYIGPADMLKDKHKERVDAGAQMTYKFDVESPSEVNLTQHHDGTIVQVAMIDGTFQLSDEAGIYYYSLSVRWVKDKEQHVSRGSSNYVFVVEVMEKKDAPTAEEQAQDNQVQKELLLGRNFDSYVRLPDSYYFQGFIMLNDHEAVYISSKQDTDPRHNQLVKINLDTKESSVMWEGTDYINYFRISKAPTDDRDAEVKFILSNYEKNTFRQFVIEDGALPREVANQYENPSPDGLWYALSRNYTPVEAQISGVWGLHATTNERVQWTSGQWDTQPLWLPDSSGFLYLRDTGERLGDGAGPAYELAHYDLKKGLSTVLPFEKGYWGRIEWLDPGNTIVAHNGFDDGIGYKIIDLITQKEEQILSTTINIEYVRQLINRITRKLLISELGHFLFYDKEGKLERNMPWVTDLDEFTKRNPDFGTEEWVTHPYYLSDDGYGLGPSNLEFSPDGTQLIYTLGLMGSGGEHIVPGNRIVISKEDGSNPVWLMEDYLRISELHWTPSSNRIVVHFGIPELEGEHYLGTIEME